MKVTPVIHVNTVQQAVEQALAVTCCGADGFWLVDHRCITGFTEECYQEIRQVLPGAWIGLNRLDRDALEAFQDLPPGVNGVWVDDAGITESTEAQEYARAVAEVRRVCGFTGLYFGGVSFKYQTEVRDEGRAARLAAPLMDVICTSGSATGVAASPLKLARMRAAAPGAKLALASGVTPENVSAYAPYVDYVLVATGVQQDFHHVSEARLRQLIGVVAGCGCGPMP
jgi:hypothetical protein